MAPVGLEPTVPASERPQTHALDRTATAIGHNMPICCLYIFIHSVLQFASVNSACDQLIYIETKMYLYKILTGA